MPFLQDIIHKLEVGGGARFFRIGLSILVVLVLIVGYNWRAFRNMSTQEAMDAAQLGRNIARGKGFTTLFVRPLSIYLLRKHSADTGQGGDRARLKTMHPDLANPPVYPVVLAGLMKVLPFHYPVPAKPVPFWTSGGKFWRYQPDFLIALFNQFLFFLVVVAVFFLARRLFDAPVAWLSAILVAATEVLWRFSVSGLSTTLLLLIFMGLVWSLLLMEEEVRAPKWGPAGGLGLAGVAGACVGLGGLTRYAFGWLILPVVVFIVLFGGSRRVLMALAAVAVFAIMMGPWVARNYKGSGTPFGTATYAVLENSMLFGEHRLERSIEPEVNNLSLVPFWQKFMLNSREIVQSDLPRLGGGWLTSFFMVGLLVGFRNPALRRLRYFVLMCVLMLSIVQALGRTQLSEDSPEINSENLLVLLVPIVAIYGVSLFFLLLDQIALPFPEMRYIVMGVFILLVRLPIILTFLPPRTIPVAYPPYFPPAIQNCSGWLNTNELAMSDIPWAVAWYGDRQCVWLTLNAEKDFFAVNDFLKPVSLLYLTPATMDNRFLSQWIRAGEKSWGSFILESLSKKEIPPYFPLRKSQAGWLPEQLVLTDWERWRKTP